MILSVDLGQKTTGLAISGGTLVTPHSTISHQSFKEVVSKVAQICDRNEVDTVVVGYVEGKTKKYFEKFALFLKKQLPQINIKMWDETLSTRQARETMIKLNVPKLKRAKKEHEIAASLILQSYLSNLER